MLLPVAVGIPAFAWPDASSLTAIGTIVLAVGALGGLFFSGLNARYLARQTYAAVEASFPYIRVEDQPRRRQEVLGGANIDAWRGTILVAGGNAPAREVSVWVRDKDCLYYAWIGVLLAQQRKRFVAYASPGMEPQCPFPIVLGEPFTDQQRVWLGLVWQCPDRSFRYNLHAIQRTEEWDAQAVRSDQTDPDFEAPKPARRTVGWRRVRKQAERTRAWVRKQAERAWAWIRDQAWPWIREQAKRAWAWMREQAWPWIREQTERAWAWIRDQAWPWIRKEADRVWGWARQLAAKALATRVVVWLRKRLPFLTALA